MREQLARVRNEATLMRDAVSKSKRDEAFRELDAALFSISDALRELEREL